MQLRRSARAVLILCNIPTAGDVFNRYLTFNIHNIMYGGHGHTRWNNNNMFSVANVVMMIFGDRLIPRVSCL